MRRHKVINSKHVTFLLSSAHYDFIERASHAKMMNMSEFMRHAIDDMMKSFFAETIPDRGDEVRNPTGDTTMT